MTFDWNDYSTESGTEDVPLLLSQRSQVLILAAMQNLEFRSNWVEVDDATWDDIDAAVGDAYEEIMELVMPDFTPVGVVTMWGHHTSIPDKWLFCYGQEVDIDDYPDLYAVIGWAYGSPSVGTKFKLPNLVDRFPLGADSGDSEEEIGNTGGEENHVLTIAEMPAHSHNILKASTVAAINTRAAIGSNNAIADQSTSSVGSGNAHNNMPPFLRIEFIIKALP